MRYAEIRNANGAHVIDDQYQNYRLSTIPLVKMQRCLTGLHIEKNESGDRICTFPYYDYANGKAYAWPQDGKYPNPWCSPSTPNKVRGKVNVGAVRTHFCGRREDFTDTRVMVSSRCLCSIVLAGIRDSQSAPPIPCHTSSRSVRPCRTSSIPLQLFSTI